MDKAAAALGIDPVEIRRRNLIRTFPYTSVTGLVFDEATYRETLELAAKAIDLAGVPRAPEEGARARAAISASALRPSPSAPATARRPSPRAAWRSRRLRARRASRWTRPATSRRGSAPRRTARACARRSPRSSPTSSASTPDAHPHHPRRHRPHALWLGHLRQPLAGDLRRRLLARGAQGCAASCSRSRATCWKRRPTTSCWQDGQARVAGTDRAIAIATLARAAYHQAIGSATSTRACARRATYDPAGTFSNACHVAIVEVDIETGGVRIERFLVAEDAGRLINPMIADGQVHGGVAQGIANALFEEIVYDAERQHPHHLARRLPAADRARDPADRDCITSRR